ncbi:Crotonase superfamily [Moorella glycerini]|uniref:short-chain-enoyl-CoA hydratase n=1 Tax=Neomoorella stamsii TaxID=1266720 RepID=A0A9X7J5S0_9FIRM|nr:putative enoyl-CoA hydratase echA8 [Moorella stamsii]CEP66852.1 Crotonase superfamily [Moorella glycerini]
MHNVILEKEESLGIVTINRPESLNALNYKVLRELRTVFEEIKNDVAVKAVIITGAGEKAFVAGADIAEMKNMSPEVAYRFARLGQETFSAIEKFSKPVIAAVNGFALGGGCELVMACDFRIASEKAKFGQPEVGLGIIPGFGGTQRLARIIGKAKAMELILMGNMIDAEEAARLGLVNMVVPPGDLLAKAKEVGKLIASKAPIAVKLAKAAINYGIETDLETACAYEAGLFGICFGTADQKEGIEAFIEKRKPQFQGF